MRSLYTAIIHLRNPSISSVRSMVEPALRLVRGVHEVSYEPAEQLITVRFDRELTGLAELVRLVEDIGSSVTGVAQRRAVQRSAS